MEHSIRNGLHRRHFISNHADEGPIDTIRLVSPINRFAIFQGNFSNDDDDYPEKPYKLKTKLVITALAVLVFVSALSGYLIGNADYSRRPGEPPDPIEPLKPSASRLHVFQRSAVCTDAPACSQIGSKILADNGTAVDAAIAAMFCNGLRNHQSMGLGGGFFMTVYIKDEGKAYTVNAREMAPGAATVDMFHGSNDKSSKGPLAVGVPGELRGMWLAYKNWGKLPWKDLIAPTIEMCKAGFKINDILYHAFMTNSKIKNDPHMRKMYFNSAKGEFYKPGTMVKPPQELCNTFQRIADNGGDELYNGTLAADFVDDLERVGSIISADDLRAYQAKLTDPIAVPLMNGDTLYSPPPPASGVILANILNILSGYHFNESSINSTEDKILTYHRIIEAFKYAYAARTKLGDIDFLDLKEFIHKVTSPEYGTEVRLRINDTMTSNDINTYGAETYNQPDSGTAHVSIIAPNGDAVSVTSSINYYFGASFSTLKTGIVLNNVMDDFSSPGITNFFGLKPSPANFIAPYKRPLSSMSPSIIVDSNGNAKLVIGAAGGTKITTAIALVTIRKLWFKQNVKEAVDEPRIHHQITPMDLSHEFGVTAVTIRTLWLGQTLKEAIDEARMHHQITPMRVDYEFGIIKDILQGLRAKGHIMTRYRDRGSVLCALYRNRTAIYGNADFRKGGEVIGV